eukprot:3161021-Pleurochrysis_carterae.AAC.2
MQGRKKYGVKKCYCLNGHTVFLWHSPRCAHEWQSKRLSIGAVGNFLRRCSNLKGKQTRSENIAAVPNTSMHVSAANCIRYEKIIDLASNARARRGQRTIPSTSTCMMRACTQG